MLCVVIASLAFRAVPLPPSVRAVAAPPVVLRATPPVAVGIAQVAAGANLASFSIYGAALLFKPATLMKEVMKSDVSAWRFTDETYAIAQYLGAVYIAQALRMVRALSAAAFLKEHLMGVGVVQLFLCVTSLARLLKGLDRNAVTLSLPVGQGFMAALSFVGYASA